MLPDDEQSAEKEWTTLPVDDALRSRVLARLGATGGRVEVTKEEWDLGYCETCSYPEEGFAVRVDGEQVWPSQSYLVEYGGYIYADEEGHVEEDGSLSLSPWGHFFRWLDGSDFPAGQAGGEA